MPSNDSTLQGPGNLKERFDVLGETERSTLFSGSMLLTKPDYELQLLVEEAARIAQTPIALVTLLTDRLQLFRAHTGLPEEIRHTLATDRDVSFCQNVVATDDVFEVNDAPNDPRVPQHLVDTLGVTSYLGVPIRTHEGTLGALCVIDVSARTFTAEQQAQLEALGRKVERRMDQLRAVRRASRSTEPVFAELRNLLTPMLMSVDSIEYTLADALAHERYLKHTHDAATLGPTLQNSADALLELVEEFEELSRHLDDLVANLDALQDATCDTGSACYLPRVLKTVSTLTHHLTKVSGGLEVPQDPERWALNTSLGDLASTLAAAINVGSSNLNNAEIVSPITLTTTPDDEAGWMHFDIASQGFGEHDLAALDNAMRDILPTTHWQLELEPSRRIRLSVPLLTR